MNEGSWVSLIALGAWLILAVSAFRAHRVGARKMITMGLMWASIFVAVALIFHAIGR